MLSFFPRGVLDEILNLIESVSEDFPSYSIISIINYHYIVIVALKTGKSYSHEEKGVKNYKSELKINTLVH